LKIPSARTTADLYADILSAPNASNRSTPRRSRANAAPLSPASAAAQEPEWAFPGSRHHLKLCLIRPPRLSHTFNTDPGFCYGMVVVQASRDTFWVDGLIAEGSHPAQPCRW
jgi:hypothetical protein